MLHVTRILLIALFVMGLSSCKDDELDRFASTDTRMAVAAQEFLKDDRIHSVSIALYHKGQAHTFHFGEQNPGKNNPPTDSTLYELASVTKTVTGMMVAKAVLDNKIALDDDIRKYLPQDYPNLQYKGAAITLEHLITHTSGFPNFLPSVESKEDFWHALHAISIEHAPGTRFHYSNTAPEVTAFILEKVYGAPYQDLVKEFILEPNGMTSTSLTLSDQNTLNLIQGYNGEQQPQPHYQNRLWGGIAGLHSNTKDLNKYIQYVLDDAVPEVEESRKRFFSTHHGFDMGYHWNILELEGETCYRHHGGIWGMQNWLMIFPESDMGIAVLSNASFEGSVFSPGIDDRLETLALHIKKALTE